MFIKTIRKWFVPKTKKGQARKGWTLTAKGEKRQSQTQKGDNPHTNTLQENKNLLPFLLLILFFSFTRSLVGLKKVTDTEVFSAGQPIPPTLSISAAHHQAKRFGSPVWLLSRFCLVLRSDSLTWLFR